MPSEILKEEIAKARSEFQQNKSSDIPDDKAFSYVLLTYFFDVENFDDKYDRVTDGANDGGVDFLYFNDEESKLFICQSKYTENISYGDIRNEFDKICDTINNFRKSHTGAYNENLKRTLQNFLDRLPDDELDNIEIAFFTSADIKDTEDTIKKLANDISELAKFTFSIYSCEDIEKKIQEKLSEIITVSFAKLEIDKPKNILSYETEHARGIMVNVKSTSLGSLYNKFSSKGLFDMNIRGYIRNQLVDDKIRETLSKNRGDFWFLNNGIVIACEDFDVDGNKIALTNFSIVNGGQTTYLIGEYKGTNSEIFYIPCKIVAETKRKSEVPFPTKIAEATNSQKPILPRDLKSNSPEMLRLARMLKNNDIYMEVKRSSKKPKIMSKYSVRNDVLAQIILSMVNQIPGIARHSSKRIFESPRLYNSVFRVNYEKDGDKKAFLIDLIQLYSRFVNITNELKNSGLTPEQVSIMKNGMQIIFALLGVTYRLANGDVTEQELLQDKNIAKNRDFVYGQFVSAYQGDDIDEKLKRLIKDIVIVMTESYRAAYDNGITMSVNNYFKSDTYYMDRILGSFVNILSTITIGADLKAAMDIFRRFQPKP